MHNAKINEIDICVQLSSSLLGKRSFATQVCLSHISQSQLRLAKIKS